MRSKKMDCVRLNTNEVDHQQSTKREGYRRALFEMMYVGLAYRPVHSSYTHLANEYFFRLLDDV